MKTDCFITAIGLSLLFSACELEKTIDVKLPEHEKQLVAEAYLEKDQPLRILLTESDPYFDSLRFPFVNDASIVLTRPDGFSDTLLPEPYLDLPSFKFYNYTTKEPVRGQAESYDLTISHKGRLLSGRCGFLPAPELDTIEIQYTPDSVARFLFWIKDPPGAANYYRIILNEDSLTGQPALEFPFTDGNFDGSIFPVGTSFRFSREKKYILRLFHIEQQYYLYLRAISSADRANGNPFAQPATVKSPMSGNGYGIFTSLNYIRKELNP